MEENMTWKKDMTMVSIQYLLMCDKIIILMKLVFADKLYKETITQSTLFYSEWTIIFFGLI